MCSPDHRLSRTEDRTALVLLRFLGPVVCQFGIWGGARVSQSPYENIKTGG